MQISESETELEKMLSLYAFWKKIIGHRETTQIDKLQRKKNIQFKIGSDVKSHHKGNTDTNKKGEYFLDFI